MLTTLAAGLALGGCTLAADAQLERARTLLEGGRPGEAIPLLQQIVARRPENADANLLLGQVLLQTGQSQPAIPALQRALDSDQHAVTAGLLLASAQIRDGRPADAIQAVDRVLEKRGTHPAALRIRATAHLQLGAAEQALGDAEKILAVAPDDPEGRTLLGTALIRLGRLDEAEQVLLEAERAEADSGSDSARHARACMLLAAFYASAREDPERAEATWNDCLERHPADPVVVQGATAFLDQRGEAGRAVAVLERAVEARPQALGLRLALARHLAAAGRTGEGDALLRAAAERDGGWGDWNALATFRRGQGDADGALEALAHAVEAAPEMRRDALLFQRALWLLDLDRVEEAAAFRDEIGDRAPTDLLDGRILLSRGQADDALAAFEAAIERRPGDARAHFLAGAAAQTLGRVDRALDAYRTATELAATATDAALAGARLHHAVGEHAAAVELARRHRGARGTAVREAVLVEARALSASGHLPAARALLERWLAGAGSDPEVLALLAEVLGQSDGPAAARARIDAAREAGLDLPAPEAHALLHVYAVQSLAAGDLEAALAAVDRARAARPDAEAPLLLRASLLTAAERPIEAERVLRQALERAPRDPDVLAFLGRWLHLRGRDEEALPRLERAHTAAPANVDSAYLAARILAERGDTTAAIARLRRVVDAAPLHAAALNDLAWQLADAGTDLDRAVGFARRAVRLAPTADALDTLGWVHLARGETGPAIDSLERAVAARPDEPGFRYRLGLALARAGRAAEAGEAFRAALEAAPFPEADAARRELARLDAAIP